MPKVKLLFSARITPEDKVDGNSTLKESLPQANNTGNLARANQNVLLTLKNDGSLYHITLHLQFRSQYVQHRIHS